MALVMPLLVAGCADDSPPGEAGPKVVAVSSIWGDVAREVVGDEGTVEVLMPIGADAHDFEPSPRQIADMIKADLVIVNGLGLEAGMEDTLAAARRDGARILELGPQLDPLRLEDGAGLDPHVWFDPIRVSEAASLIAVALNELQPDGPWEARASAYAETMEQVDEEIAGLMESIAPDRRKLVTNHEALGYLAHRYGLEVIGVVVPGGSTLGEPSSAELAELVKIIDDLGVPAIFAETSHPNRLAEAVAAEAGHPVEVIDLHTESLGAAGSESATLAGMLIENARSIVTGLGGQG